MFQLFLVAAVLVAVAFVGLAAGILIKGKFPDTHVGNNPDMKKLGITCAKNEAGLCQGRSASNGCQGCREAPENR